MQPANRRRPVIRNGVVSGSVWETRMKMDQVKGGIKVFNAAQEIHDDEEGLLVYQRLRRNQRDEGSSEKKKRKSWKQPESPRSPILLSKERSVEIDCKSIEEVKVVEESDHDKGMDLAAEKDQKVEELKKSSDFLLPLPPANDDNKEMDLPAEKDQKVEVLKMRPDPLPLPSEGEIPDESSSRTSNRMQHIVDLIMWRDVSKTAFAFGLGTFFLVSSIYAKDLKFSMVSAVSYVGLVYLAVIFIFRSIIRREEKLEFDRGDESYLIGEEEAVWILRRILPYLNELLSRSRALFSGDPATTMKMAVFLFALAKCGSSITIWTLAKLAFFGVFTIPKVLATYSVQLGRHGSFWLARFHDGWESCTHKKAIAAAVFTLIWNLSSAIARIWAVFMLVVALRLYQQCRMAAWNEEDVVVEQNQQQQQQQQQ